MTRPIVFRDAWRDDIATASAEALSGIREAHPDEEFRVYWINDRDIGAVGWGIEMVVGRRFFGRLRVWRNIDVSKALESDDDA